MSSLIVVLAVLGGLPIPMLAAWVLTPLLTGWRRNPNLVQGCESSVHCAEMNTLMVVWGLSLLGYAVLCAWAYRAAVRREAAQAQRARDRTWPWQ